MPNVIVNIAGGTQQENTTAVTIGAVKWGLNGTAAFGLAQAVPPGLQDLIVDKTTVPLTLSIKVDVPAYDVTVNVTVNNDTIAVTSI
jgi:hypothetical protein